MSRRKALVVVVVGLSAGRVDLTTTCRCLRFSSLTTRRGATLTVTRILHSTLFIPKTSWRCDEWFMQLMQPMVHYVPVDYDLHNLSATLRWARANDARVRSVGANAFAFASRYLNKRAILEYMHALLSHMHR